MTQQWLCLRRISEACRLSDCCKNSEAMFSRRASRGASAVRVELPACAAARSGCLYTKHRSSALSAGRARRESRLAASLLRGSESVSPFNEWRCAEGPSAFSWRERWLSGEARRGSTLALSAKKSAVDCRQALHETPLFLRAALSEQQAVLPLLSHPHHQQTCAPRELLALLRRLREFNGFVWREMGQGTAADSLRLALSLPVEALRTLREKGDFGRGKQRLAEESQVLTFDLHARTPPVPTPAEPQSMFARFCDLWKVPVAAVEALEEALTWEEQIQLASLLLSLPRVVWAESSSVPTPEVAFDVLADTPKAGDAPAESLRPASLLRVSFSLRDSLTLCLAALHPARRRLSPDAFERAERLEAALFILSTATQQLDEERRRKSSGRHFSPAVLQWTDDLLRVGHLRFGAESAPPPQRAGNLPLQECVVCEQGLSVRERTASPLASLLSQEALAVWHDVANSNSRKQSAPQPQQTASRICSLQFHFMLMQLLSTEKRADAPSLVAAWTSLEWVALPFSSQRERETCSESVLNLPSLTTCCVSDECR